MTFLTRLKTLSVLRFETGRVKMHFVSLVRCGNLGKTFNVLNFPRSCQYIQTLVFPSTCMFCITVKDKETETQMEPVCSLKTTPSRASNKYGDISEGNCCANRQVVAIFTTMVSWKENFQDL